MKKKNVLIFKVIPCKFHQLFTNVILLLQKKKSFSDYVTTLDNEIHGLIMSIPFKKKRVRGLII